MHGTAMKITFIVFAMCSVLIKYLGMKVLGGGVLTEMWQIKVRWHCSARICISYSQLSVPSTLEWCITFSSVQVHIFVLFVGCVVSTQLI
jgi:hypothetical protein